MPRISVRLGRRSEANAEQGNWHGYGVAGSEGEAQVGRAGGRGLYRVRMALWMGEARDIMTFPPRLAHARLFAS